MTFATPTIEKNQKAIAAIEAQIEVLQQKLTEIQNQHQQILSAQQKGQSAIAQYQEAIQAIAALNEPEMLEAFLNQMSEITSAAIKSGGHANALPPSDDSPEDTAIATEPEPTPPAPTNTDDCLEVEATTLTATNPDIDLVDETEPETETETSEITDTGLDFSRFSFVQLRRFVSQHGLSTSKRHPKRHDIEKAIASAGHHQSELDAWIDISSDAT